MPKLPKSIIIPIIFITIIMVIIFIRNNSKSTHPQSNPTATPQSQTESNQPRVVSIDPDPIKNPILTPNQPINVTFNVPIDDIKQNMDPKFDYDANLSGDHKTVTIKPKTNYPLGSNLTFTITQDTKFSNKLKLDSDVTLRYQTIQYKGV